MLKHISKHTSSPQESLSIHLLLLLGVLTVFFYLGSLVYSIMWPFIIALILAYICTPTVCWMQKLGVPRKIGALAMVLVILVLVSGFFALILPLILTQITQIIEILPMGIERGKAVLASYGIDIPNASEIMSGHVQGMIETYWGQSLQVVVSGFGGIVNGAVLVVLVPVIAYYLLCSFYRIPPLVTQAVPPRYRGFFMEWMGDLDMALSAFFRGQLIVMFAIGCMYALGLSVIGLQYALAVGILAGVLSFIPYIGSFMGVLMATLIALVQFSDPTKIVFVWGVHVLIQTLEGTLLTPNIVGDKVGLNPVWLIFALLAFGTILGFLGVLLAVPIAAMIGVSVRVIFKYYTQSTFYKGT